MSILVSDYDGTFANSSENIRLNCQKIYSFLEDGNTFVLSSGRDYSSLLRQVTHYGIPYSYLATADGSYLFDRKGNSLLSHKMSHDIVSSADRLKDISNCKRLDYAYEREYSPLYRENDDISSISFVIDVSNVTREFDKEFIHLQENNPSYDFCTYGYGSEVYYMIKCKGMSKSSPILYLQKHLAVPKEDIFTIGDGLNDLEMIRDFNGFVIGDNEELNSCSLKRYDAVFSLVDDISKNLVKRR